MLRTITKLSGYTLPIWTGAAYTPLDAATFVFGMELSGTAPSYNAAAIAIPKAGVIKRVDYVLRIVTTLASNENVQHFLRINDTTDVGLVNTTWDAVHRAFSATPNTPVNAGDFVAGKVVCPTWVTNPAGVTVRGLIYIEP
jgi:hypothetical protein